MISYERDQPYLLIPPGEAGGEQGCCSGQGEVSPKVGENGRHYVPYLRSHILAFTPVGPTSPDRGEQLEGVLSYHGRSSWLCKLLGLRPTLARAVGSSPNTSLPGVLNSGTIARAPARNGS